MTPRRLFLLLVAFTLTTGLANAATFDVNSTLDEPDATPGDGLCESTPSGVCTLRAAIIEANQDAVLDIVNVPAGIYTLTVTGIEEYAAETGDLNVLASLTIIGAGTSTTIIDADGIDRVFDVRPGEIDLSLDSLTVRGGSAITSGSRLGGGIFHLGRNLWLTRVRVTGNVANSAGGLFVTYGSHASIQESTFDNNEAINAGFSNPHGPAIFTRGSLSLVTTTVFGNTAVSWSLASIHGSGCSNGGLQFINSTIVYNSSGAIYSYNCNVLARHVTVVGNDGQGLQFGSFDDSHTLDVGNSLFFDNSVSDCNFSSGVPTFQNSLDGDDTCGLSALAGDLPATDPQLLPLRNWGGSNLTMYPKLGSSPVIDAGAGGAVCEALDQRYYDRGNDGNGDGQAGCDIGAVEAGDLVFYDDLETGDTGAWSSTVGEVPKKIAW
jgi:CSLREA domain-containing protein